MVTREDNTATATLAGTEKNSPTMDWSVEYMHKEFMIFKTLAEMWLETMGAFDIKQNMFILSY